MNNASGGSETSVRFRDWKTDDWGIGLSGVMVWDGELAVDEVRYDVRQKGTRIHSGTVGVTGSYFKKNEPTEVSISIGREPTSDMTVTIEVQH